MGVGGAHRESPLLSRVKISTIQKGLEKADSCHMFTCLVVRETEATREKKAASVAPLPDENADLCLHGPETTHKALRLHHLIESLKPVKRGKELQYLIPTS